jgi:predicted nucleic acid-binding protein
VAVKWVIPEPDAALAQQVADDTGLAGGRLVVLDLGLTEVAQALWKLFHRGLLPAHEVPGLFGQVVGRPVHVVPAQPLIPKAIELATRYDRSVYDCLFVALAIDLSIAGVTSDEPLWKAVHADHPQIHLLRDWPPP